MQRKKLKWIIDDSILAARNSTGNIIKSIIDSGRSVYVTKYVPFADEQDYGFNEDGIDSKGNSVMHTPFLLYGSIGYVTKCNYPAIPGSYGINENTHCNVYYSNIPKEWMLNEDFVMVPFEVLKNDTDRIFDLFGTDDLFIRPNSGRKTFTGYTITRENAKFELSCSMQLTSVLPETIILVSSAKKINSEFRFVVGNGEVIDGSEYRWDNIMDVRHDWLEDCHKLASKMARHEWQPDVCYTVDVADTPNGPKIIELNGFSCAGLYACDKNLVVERISEIAEKDFYGEI